MAGGAQLDVAEWGEGGAHAGPAGVGSALMGEGIDDRSEESSGMAINGHERGSDDECKDAGSRVACGVWGCQGSCGEERETSEPGEARKASV